MRQEEILLGALSVGMGAIHTPVQVQKLLFLIDKNVASTIGGPFFHFQPYAYGPFDKQICDLLAKLKNEGDIEEVRNSSLQWAKYRLTTQGQKKGEVIMDSIDRGAKKYIVQLSTFVRSLSFSSLVSAIYKEYPEMRANSVFRE